jgi:ABC-type branched-subunit amino acid transport system substrate-binding protein
MAVDATLAPYMPSGGCSTCTSCVVELGVLLPMFGSGATGGDSLLPSARVGVYQAVKETNNKSDGVADQLLPKTRLHISYYDSKCDSYNGLMGALHHTRDAFNRRGVKAIIGAGCSEAPFTAAQVAADAQVPIISPSSGHPALSNSRDFPYFLRTLPSDAVTATAMVDGEDLQARLQPNPLCVTEVQGVHPRFGLCPSFTVLQHLLNYSSVALVTSTTSDGMGVMLAFGEAAAGASMAVSVSVTFDAAAPDFHAQHQQLLRSMASIIVIFATGAEANRFMQSAFNVGIGGVGFLFVVSDPSLSDAAYWSGDDTLRLRTLRGLFALVRHTGDGSTAHSEFLARRRELLLTTAAAANSSYL